MSIIFVDFDGVLVPWRTTTLKRRPAIAPPALVQRLDTLCADTNSSVVIVSDWRDGKGKCERVLREWGFAGRVAGETGRDATRSHEVCSYVSKNCVERFVILDDEVSRYAGNPLCLEKLVETNKMVGLSSSDFERALKILQG